MQLFQNRRILKQKKHCVMENSSFILHMHYIFAELVEIGFNGHFLPHLVEYSYIFLISKLFSTSCKIDSDCDATTLDIVLLSCSHPSVTKKRSLGCDAMLWHPMLAWRCACCKCSVLPHHLLLTSICQHFS